MKRLILAGLCVAALAMPAMAAPVTETFTYAQMGTVIDPKNDGPLVDNIDKDVVTDPTGRVITGAGTFLDHTRMNDYTLGMGVVNFNTRTVAMEVQANKLVQYYDAADTKRVEFTVVQGLGAYETGYNYSGFTSGGREAVSGTNIGNIMGTMAGNAPGNTGLSTNICAWDVGLVGARTDEYVKYIGGVVIGKTDTAQFNLPTMNVTYENMTTEVQQTASMQYTGWIGGNVNLNAMFYGYRAPENCEIVRVSFDCVASNYGAFDDLTFGIAPEPGTMVLLGLGGLGMLIRRKRS